MCYIEGDGVAQSARRGLEYVKAAAARGVADAATYVRKLRAQHPTGREIMGRFWVKRLGEMPIQSCGQSVNALCGKAGARLNAHTELRAKRQRSAQEATYRNRPLLKTPT
jgi:hypothetical protein